MLAAIAVVALCVLLACLSSVGFVEQNEYGLIYNWVTKQISNSVYHGGTHVIGPWNSFVTFPATVRTLEFSDRIGMRTAEPLHTRTKEGLGLHLSISFQYTLNKESIPKLYALTNVQYEGLFTRIARDQLLEAAAVYEGPEYWLSRKKIGDHMRELVNKQLKESFASLWGLQLLVIDLPDRYEKSITMTQVQHQIIKTRESQQVAASIRADTEVMKAGFSRDIAVVQAAANANFTLATKVADAEAARRKIAAEAEALQYVRNKMKLSPEGAVKYAELAAYGTLQNATFLANIKNAMPMITMGGLPSEAAAPQADFLQKEGIPQPAGTGGSASSQSPASSFLQRSRVDTRIQERFEH